MSSATIYLRAPLFVPSAIGGVPKHSMILSGTLIDGGQSGGFTVAVSRWADQHGKTLEGTPTRLFVPMAKIDHVRLED